MINNTVVVQLKTFPPKNPYKKQVTPNDKLRVSQDERTSIMKSLAFNIKDMKKLEANPDVIQYLKACKLVGSSHVQLYLSKFEESKKLKAKLFDVENDIKVHKTAASNLLAISHENYQCPVLDDDQVFASPCDNMDDEEIEKVMANGKAPSIKAIASTCDNMDDEEIDNVIGNGKVPSIKAIASPCDNMDDEEMDKVIGNGKVPSIKAIVVMPATVTPSKKRKVVAQMPSMGNDSSEIVTRAKGLAGSRAKSICIESGKKNEE